MIKKMSKEYFHTRVKGIVKSECSQALKKNPDRLRLKFLKERSMKQLVEQQICEPVTIVIFGASGDLTHRKLIPALYAAFQQKLLPEQFSIVGFARRDYDTPLFRSMMADAVVKFSRLDVDEALVGAFVEHIDYFKGDLSNPEAYQALRTLLAEPSRYPENRMYYLSIIPDLF